MECFLHYIVVSVTCHPQTHLPGFVASLDKFKAAGADVIVFTAVNDPFVLTEWGVVHQAIGKVPRAFTLLLDSCLHYFCTRPGLWPCRNHTRHVMQLVFNQPGPRPHHTQIRFLADTHCKLAEAFDVVLDATERLGNKRGKR